MSEEVFEQVDILKKFNYDNIYKKALNKSQEKYIKTMFNKLYDLYLLALQKEEKVISIYDNFLLKMSDEYIKNKTLADFEQSLFKILNENIEIGYAHHEIEAIMVTDEISKYLNIKGQQPIFKVKTITYTPDAIPIFFDTSFYQADKYSFKSTLTRLR